MDQFRQADCGERRFLIARCRHDSLDELLDRVASAFGGNHYTRVEDQSHAGGFNGSRWLSIAASTSLAKSPSSVAVEACSLARRKDSESSRRCGSAGRSTATGSLPLSITTSAPARTRASTSAKLLAASASEMWITWSAMARLYRHSSWSDKVPLINRVVAATEALPRECANRDWLFNNPHPPGLVVSRKSRYP